jgi:phosphohistidine phosphatase
MELILWRHAEAAPGDPDAARALTAHGHRQAKAMAAFLSPLLPADLRCIASPARRAQETAAALGRPVETVEAVAPGCSVATLLAAAGWPDSPQPVLLVGHQPTLGEAASWLVEGRPAGWGIATASICWLASRPRKGRGEADLLASVDADLLLRAISRGRSP